MLQYMYDPLEKRRADKSNGILTKKVTINRVRPGLPGGCTLDRFPIQIIIITVTTR